MKEQSPKTPTGLSVFDHERVPDAMISCSQGHFRADPSDVRLVEVTARLPKDLAIDSKRESQ